TLSGRGNGVLGKVTGVETIDVKSGSWRITGVTISADVIVEAGASLGGGTLAQGANLYMYGTSTVVTVLGKQIVEAGGVDFGAMIGAGGEQHVVAGASANNVFVNGGGQFVAGTATGTTVNDGGLQTVYGSATGTTVNDGGQQNVSAGATASGTTLNEG